MVRQDIFLRPKPILILHTLFGIDERDRIMHNIHKKTGISYARVWKIVKMFHKHNLISREKKGRDVVLNLTTKGFNFANELQAIERILKEAQNGQV